MRTSKPTRIIATIIITVFILSECGIGTAFALRTEAVGEREVDAQTIKTALAAGNAAGVTKSAGEIIVGTNFNPEKAKNILIRAISRTREFGSTGKYGGIEEVIIYDGSGHPMSAVPVGVEPNTARIRECLGRGLTNIIIEGPTLGAYPVAAKAAGATAGTVEEVFNFIQDGLSKGALLSGVEYRAGRNPRELLNKIDIGVDRKIELTGYEQKRIRDRLKYIARRSADGLIQYWQEKLIVYVRPNAVAATYIDPFKALYPTMMEASALPLAVYDMPLFKLYIALTQLDAIKTRSITAQRLIVVVTPGAATTGVPLLVEKMGFDDISMVELTPENMETLRRPESAALLLGEIARQIVKQEGKEGETVDIMLCRLVADENLAVGKGANIILGPPTGRRWTGLREMVLYPEEISEQILTILKEHFGIEVRKPGNINDALELAARSV